MCLHALLSLLTCRKSIREEGILNTNYIYKWNIHLMHKTLFVSYPFFLFRYFSGLEFFLSYKLRTVGLFLWSFVFGLYKNSSFILVPLQWSGPQVLCHWSGSIKSKQLSPVKTVEAVMKCLCNSCCAMPTFLHLLLS
jgi:hypothetical protein